MLKQIKLAVLSAAGSTGLSRLALQTNWRKQKLLILCYHGISLEDEHRWDAELYMTPDSLRKRFMHLRKAGCNVLPLSEAIKALYAGQLPPRAVAVTFDDGFFDFYARALPLAQEFRYPLTVYLTTYYSYFNRPVFDLALKYILWKGLGRTLRLPEALRQPIQLNHKSIVAVGQELYQHVTKLKFSGLDKNRFLEMLAGTLNIDFQSLCDRRLLHLMTPEEVGKVAAAGVEVQLHTHRHRLSRGRHQFQREINDNRERIESITHKPAQHFCYPSGFFLPEYSSWLTEMNVASATTCVRGIATPDTSPFLLPRLVDSSNVSESEFGAWVSGLASFLPRWKFVMDQRSFLEPEPETLDVKAALNDPGLASSLKTIKVQTRMQARLREW